MSTELVERLRAHVAELEAKLEQLRGETYLSSAEAAEFHRDNAVTMWNAEREKNTALTAKVALLTEALRPFAREADARANLALGPDIDHWPIGGSALTLGDIRRARRALSEPDKEGAL